MTIHFIFFDSLSNLNSYVGLENLSIEREMPVLQLGGVTAEVRGFFLFFEFFDFSIFQRRMDRNGGLETRKQNIFLDMYDNRDVIRIGMIPKFSQGFGTF